MAERVRPSYNPATRLPLVPTCLPAWPMSRTLSGCPAACDKVSNGHDDAADPAFLPARVTFEPC